MKKNLFKDFNQEFFKSFGKNTIRWFDKEGIIELVNGYYVSIEIDDVGVRNDYNGYHVKVYSKSNGLLKSKFFRFCVCFELNHVWLCDGKFEWYTVVQNKKYDIPTDTEIKNYCDEIKEYISLIAG